MVSSRRTRIIMVMVWTFIFGLTIYGYRSSQKSRDTSEFMDSVEEKTRLEPEIIKENSGGMGAPQDLTNDPGQPFNPEKEYNVILSEAPIVIFSKSYCPHSKAVKDILLNEYQITPRPWVVELDMHPHGRELQDYIGQVTGRRTVPNVHVKKVSRGGGDEFRLLNAEGTLAETMQSWGGNSFRVKKNPSPPGAFI